jgi:hypothetical protein
MAGRHSRGAAAFVSLLLAAVVLAGGGCEIAIQNDPPDFECVQGPAVCPPPQVCDPSSHQCVAPCSTTLCADGLQCDPVADLCVPVSGGSEASPSDAPTLLEANAEANADARADQATMPDEAAPPVEAAPAEGGLCRNLGCACTGDASCDSGVCADSSTIPAMLYQAAGSQSFCSKPCCTSADCSVDMVCFAAGGADSAAGNYCVAPGWVSRSPSLGLTPGGATCAMDLDCRSGRCAGGTCADTCCSTSATSQCALGSVCRFATFPGVAAFDDGFVAWCGPGGSGANGYACYRDSDCASELCDGAPDGCADACRNSGDCSAGESCVYVNPPAPNDAFVVAACFGGAGSTPEGGPCTTDVDCQSQFCDTTIVPNVCSDVCFADSDCTQPGWRCRPESLTLYTTDGVPVGKFTALACGP